ncbi:aspartate aminotransferase family protein [Reinekea blandensis]|uniref:Diaminobutyrate--2-oxoglutarate aminotransferase n=1 Tax=Reinekea blandensis MED297 TaxID=314283 RepID=A4BCR9_9GAMM|nr:aspartate aminotransferase family protein [Reinekea blandensis]EAR10001.1 diaminobutyrate--2-oxoglutarate aminotransferase [Reinekea sp. MED297] [Reinekea blandensis MED297]
MSIFEQRESNIRGYSRVYPTVFDKALNAKQIDENGKEYLDFFAGAGVLNFGHNNENMTKAVIEYIQSNGVLHSLDMSTTIKRKFMQKFVDTVLEPRNMPHRLQFIGPTGTNAVEAAMKLARRVTGRQSIVAFNHAFHGMTLGSLAATANSYFRGAAGVPLNHVRHQSFGCETPCMGCELGCGENSLQQLRAQYLDSSSGLEKPAAFLVEVIQAEGGVNVADKAWLKGVEQLAKELGALFIVDDIQVGMGRTGSFFSFDDYNIDPDIVCLAKGLGGLGTPIAMNLIKPEHDDHWSPGEHTGTFRGQSVSFVAGIEALKYFDDTVLMKDVARKGNEMREMLSDLDARSDVQIRGKGMILGIDVGDGDVAKKIVATCFENGVLLGACGTGGRVIKLIPPLTIDDDDLNKGMSIVIKATQDALEAG